MQEKEKKDFIAECKEALESRQFILYLQPKYNVSTENVYGAEVLVRWQHPQKGLMMPKDFLPQCEVCHMMEQLDYYMWEQACRLLVKWQSQGHHECTLSVKISKNSLYNPKIVARLEELVNRYQINRDLLQLEIEEDSIRADIYQAQEAIGYLREAGFTVLLDDFSYGCSSISALNQIDVDILKVDMKFFSDSNNAGKGEVILASIIKSANWLGMAVLAECVETQQQFDFAQASGCDYVQGFFFSKPLPEALFETTCLSNREVEKNGRRAIVGKEAPTHNLTIMVIDDLLMERELLEKYLKDDFHIQLCESAESALAFLQQSKNRVDMILVDYMMPGMNGLEFLQFCQSDEKLKRIPKIMITSNERVKDQVKAFQAGAYDYLTKPLIPELVRVRIRHAMELNHRLQTSEHEKKKYQQQAETDKATGLLNKMTFQQQVEQYLLEHKGEKNTMLIVDIDNFKSINDRYGHLMGDHVIEMVAATLSSGFRSTDFVGRFGGDEFAVLMIEGTSKAGVEKKAEAVIDQIGQRSNAELGIPVTVSIGIGFGKHTDDFDTLFSRADAALYQAKDAGKGKYVQAD